MDKNGYNESMFNTEEGICYICGIHTDTARHEIFPGANRKESKRWGMWYNTCPKCHDRWHLTDPMLKNRTQAEGQMLFEHEHGHDKFMSIFGRSYL